MGSKTRSVSVTGQDGWSLDNRGYIHGGSEETPIFQELKYRHNTLVTKQRRKDKISPVVSTPRYIQPVAVFGDPGFNRPKSHPIKES